MNVARGAAPLANQSIRVTRVVSPRPHAAAERLIVALDLTTLSSALNVARALRGVVRTVKVGSALFTACGPDAIARLRALGFRIMLDVKFFDIPSTVELSCRAAVHHHVAFLTVHASGGRAMLEAAVRGVRAESSRLKIPPPSVLAVTVLTSTPHPARTGGSGSERKGGPRETMKRVLDLVEVACEGGCDGVVASVEEAENIRQCFGQRFNQLKIVCPGIRPTWAFREDQRRIATPTKALKAGADFLVVGRPITGARDPGAAAKRLLDEMEESTRC